MGDRGNIKIGKVYLYTHWGGSDIKRTVQNALKKQWRWNDEPYLARIIFCELIKGDEAGETGFGISTSINDNEHNIIEVDVKNQLVKELIDDTENIKQWTFREFIALEGKQLDLLEGD